MLYINRKFFHTFLEITTTKSVILIAKITQKNREILEGLCCIHMKKSYKDSSKMLNTFYRKITACTFGNRRVSIMTETSFFWVNYPFMLQVHYQLL